MSGCSFGHESVVGVVNGQTIRNRDLSQRLNLPIDVVADAKIDQKRAWFEEVVRQVSMEDESKRSKLDASRLMKFFAVVDQIEVSSEERASFLERFPDLRSSPGFRLEAAIKAERRGRVEQKYRDEIFNKTAYEFLADNPKRSKVQNFWDRLSF